MIGSTSGAGKRSCCVIERGASHGFAVACGASHEVANVTIRTSRHGRLVGLKWAHSRPRPRCPKDLPPAAPFSVPPEAPPRPAAGILVGTLTHGTGARPQIPRGGAALRARPRLRRRPTASGFGFNSVPAWASTSKPARSSRRYRPPRSPRAARCPSTGSPSRRRSDPAPRRTSNIGLLDAGHRVRRARPHPVGLPGRQGCPAGGRVHVCRAQVTSP